MDSPAPLRSTTLSGPRWRKLGVTLAARTIGRVHEAPRTSWRVTLALLTVAGIAFAVMQTLVIPALPHFQREFGTSASWVAWIATGFLLSSSVLTPILGKLGDAYGKKRMLVIALAIFGLASLGAAFAWSLQSLVVFRVIQGVGAAVFPLSFGIIRDEFPPEKIGMAIGTVSSVFGVGGGIGLVLSGVIIEHLNWHWLFLIGGGPGLVSVPPVPRLVPPAPLGALLTFPRREMAATNVCTLMIGFSMFSAFILLPNFVQVPPERGFGFGASPVEVGLFFVPSSVVMMVAGPLAGALGTRAGRVLPLRLGIGSLVLALTLLAAVHHAPWTIYVWMAFMGLGLAFCFAALGTLVIDYSTAGETGVASGMNTIMRTIGAALGAQVAAAIISANTLAGTEIPLERGFTLAFAISATVALAALLPTFLLARRPAPRPVSEAI